MATLGERCDAVLAAVESNGDVRGAVEALRDDLRLSGADAISVVRDADSDDDQAQPPVVSAFTPDGTQG